MSRLIPATDLQALLQAEREIAILDVRWTLTAGPDRAAYLAGHIPGAAFVDLDADLAGRPGAGGRHPLPDPARFVAAMRSAGVRNDRAVVGYDDADGVPAARAWWLLRHYGHRNVRLLDGGWAAWQRMGGDVERGTPDVATGSFSGQPGGMAVIDAVGAGRLANDGALIDVRTRERFLGEQEPIDPVAGHIPGAVNVPMTEMLTAEGKLRPGSELRQLFAAAADRRVGVYCGSGVTAAHAVLALEEAGVDVALYPGSWSGWIADPTRPVERLTT